MWLRVKVFIGYVSLIFLLIITVGLFRKAQVNRDRLRQEEQKLHLVRGLVEQSYAGLLELSTYGEMVSVWDKEDFNSYHTKREEVCRHKSPAGSANLRYPPGLNEQGAIPSCPHHRQTAF